MTATERARALEKQGKIDEAIAAYREAGGLDDAARLLGSSKRPREAGELLLASLRVTPAQVGQLEAPGKKRALMAAIFFGRAGDHDLAVQLFLALGEQQRAVELLQRAGDSVGAARLAAMRPGELAAASLVRQASAAQPRAAVGGAAISLQAAQKLEQGGKLELALEAYLQLKRFAEAASCAERIGRFDSAAQLYADAGRPFDAAAAYRKAGDTGKELDNLVRVPRRDPLYRQAVAQAVALGTELNALPFQLEHFVGEFVKSAPQGPAERDTLYALGKLYVAHGHPDSAREAFDKLRGHRDADALAAELLEAARPTALVARQVLSDADLHRKGGPRIAPPISALPGFDDDAVPAGAPEQAGGGTDHDGPATMVSIQDAASFPELAIEDDEVFPAAQPAAAPPGPAPLFLVGATIAERYRLDQKIGQGGMAVVFKARDLELDEDVALKVFTMQSASEVLVARFKQELKLSRQLHHPNITRLYDIGLAEGRRYISMELLRGKSLKERMESPLEFTEALGLLIQACAGLQAAHDAGVIHRDVKPDNFFVTNEGVLKVMDFGIAKQFAAPGVTVAGSIAGTPQYMSPEQIGSFSTVTAATDLYALGICAYELFTGAVPFAHAELVPLLMMHVNELPVPPVERNPSIPPDLNAAILRLLEKDPAQRFASCRELSDALVAIRSRYLPPLA